MVGGGAHQGKAAMSPFALQSAHIQKVGDLGNKMERKNDLVLPSRRGQIHQEISNILRFLVVGANSGGNKTQKERKELKCA